MQKAVENDKLLREINTEIIKLDKDIYWLIYERIFDSGIFNDNLKNDIVKLLFKFNNSYAFEYLKKNYPDDGEKYRKNILKFTLTNKSSRLKAKYIISTISQNTLLKKTAKK